MKRKSQGYDDRLDESLNMKHRRRHKQSLRDRRDESKGEMKKISGHPYEGDRDMKENYKRQSFYK
jgi:hypothetical protein